MPLLLPPAQHTPPHRATAPAHQAVPDEPSSLCRVLPRGEAPQCRLLRPAEPLRRPVSLPDFCSRPGPITRTATTARVEGEAGTQRGLKCFPGCLVPTTRDGKVETGIDHRGAAAWAGMRSGRQRALLERRPARQANEVRLVGSRVSTHAVVVFGRSLCPVAAKVAVSRSMGDWVTVPEMTELLDVIAEIPGSRETVSVGSLSSAVLDVSGLLRGWLQRQGFDGYFTANGSRYFTLVN